MPDPKKTDPKSKPQAPKEPHSVVPPIPGRLKRGSDFHDQDLHDAPVEDPDDTISD
jgi:hypothetical protein